MVNGHFLFIVDIVRVNSSTLFALNGKKVPLKQNSYEFSSDLVCSLFGPFIQQRNLSHLAPFVKRKIAVLLDMMQLPNPAAAPPNKADVEHFPSKSEKRSRCYVILNSYQQFGIRNPYLESNYFAKLAVNTRVQNI